MFRLLLFLIFVLPANNMYAQGVDLDEVLKSIDPGEGPGRHSTEGDFLNEKGGSDFDPQDELDNIPSFRLEKKITETERAKKNYASRTWNQCHCVLDPESCPPKFEIYLEARRINDTRTKAEREAEKDQAKRRARKRARAEETRSSICWSWFCSGGAGSEQFASGREEQCPGGKIQKGNSDGDFYFRQLKSLQVELEKERAIEERLTRQRRAEEERKRKMRIAADEANEEQRREQSRQQAAAAQAEREARELDRCQAQWDRGRNPCGCGHLAAAPAWVQIASTCEK